MKSILHKNIALPIRKEDFSAVPLSAVKPASTGPSIISLLAGILSLAFANRIFSPLLVLSALLFCIGCGSSDTDRIGEHDGGSEYVSVDSGAGGDSDAGVEGTREDGGASVNPDNAPVDNPGESDGGSSGDEGSTPSVAFPITFEPVDGEDCPSPASVGMSTSGTTVNAVPTPYGDDSPNPDGGDCFLKIIEISTDGVITIEFTTPQDISAGTYLTFDVSHGDANMLDSAITFILLLEDEDDPFGYSANTLTPLEMEPGLWYKVSMPLNQFFDSDLETGNGVFNRSQIRRLKIRPHQASVGMNPINGDVVSELDFDNFGITNDDQTGLITGE